MFDGEVDVDEIGRKELQTLAKNFGIKANQKSVVLRDKLREAIAALKHQDGKNNNDKEIVNEGNPTNAGNKKEKLSRGISDKPATEIGQIGSHLEGEEFLEATVNREPFEEINASDAITPDEKCSIVAEDSHGDDKRDKPEASIEDHFIVCEDTKAKKEANECCLSVDAKIVSSTFPWENGSLTAKSCEIKEVEDDHGDTDFIVERSEKEENIKGENTDITDHTITKKHENVKKAIEEKGELNVARDKILVMNGGATRTTEENDESAETSKIKAFASNGKEIEKEFENNGVAIEDQALEEGDKNEIAMGKDEPIGKQIKEIKQQILTKKRLSIEPNDKSLLPTKILVGTEKHSTQKNYELNVKKSHRKNEGMKQNTKPPKKVIYQSTKERCKTYTVRHQSAIPLWKVHSKDFLRKRDADKTRDSNSKKKKSPPTTKNAKRGPFRDRLNKKAEVDDTKALGDKAIIKRNTPKTLPMSKRNEEQMKKFLERQSVGRKDRAEKERVKMYANCVKD